MNKINGLSINEAKYDLGKGKKGKIAVLIYSGSGDPKPILDYAVNIYANDLYTELIDANLDNPWMRVILSDVNEMNQEIFDADKHRLNEIKKD